MPVYSGTKMNTKLKIFVVTALLYNSFVVDVAGAGFFNWSVPDLKEEPTEELLVNSAVESKNAFEKLYAWTSVIEINKNLAEDLAEKKQEEKKEIKITKTYAVRATAYSSTPDQTDDTPFITASGTYVKDGIIAANFLPFGTQIRIPEIYGEKIFVVEDRMNKRYWHNVDIWFPERALAKAFGSRRVIIEIIEES